MVDDDGSANFLFGTGAGAFLVDFLLKRFIYLLPIIWMRQVRHVQTIYPLAAYLGGQIHDSFETASIILTSSFALNGFVR